MSHTNTKHATARSVALVDSMLPAEYAQCDDCIDLLPVQRIEPDAYDSMGLDSLACYSLAYLL